MEKATKIRSIKIALVAVAAGLLYISCVPQGSSPLTGSAAKDFSLQTPEGGSVKLLDFKGNVLVIDFWATWCPPCRESLPNLNRLAGDADLARRGLKVLAIDAQESPGEVKAFLTKNNYTLPVAIDADGAVARRYGIDGFPTTLVIGRDGKVRKVFVGYDSQSGEAELLAAVEDALSKS